MNDKIPQGWTWARIVDVTEPVHNIRPEDNPEHEFGYVDISSINNRSFSIAKLKRVLGKDAPSRARRPVRPNDTLFSNVRTYLRNIAIVPEESAAEVCSTGFTVLRPSRGIDPLYLFRYVLTNAFIDRVTPQQTGTHYPATSDRIVLGEPIPLPPLREQTRIVTKLEALLAKVNVCQKRLDAIPTILKRFRQGVLAAACAGRLTADWREKNTDVESVSVLLSNDAHDGFSNKAYGTPADWAWVNFGALVATVRGGSTVPPQNEPTAYPILRSSSVRPGSIDFTDVRYVRMGESKNEDNYLCNGDLLFTRLGGSLEYLANCALVHGIEHRRIQYPDRIFCAKLRYPAVAPYVEICFANPVLRTELTEGAKSSAGHQRISITDLTRQRMPLPPLTEQHEIVRRVGALLKLADRIEGRFIKAKAHADKLTESILAKAFRGELVPTEAEVAKAEGRDFESAIELLTRIGTVSNIAGKDGEGKSWP